MSIDSYLLITRETEPALKDRLPGRLRVRASKVITVITIVGALFFIGPGLWALFDPQSFADQLAPYEPFNEHYIHDIGAFQLGIGAALLAALWRRGDALFAALAGAAVGSAFHTATHFIDHDLGGKETDVAVFGVVTVVLATAAAFQMRISKSGERDFSG